MIIITGEKGYIANNIRKFLNDKGEKAVCASFRNGAEGVELSGADTVIHCAAIVHKREKDFADDYDRVNHTEAVRLAERAKAAGVRHFVFFSTMSVYGVSKGVINAKTACNPTTLYGKSKLAAEREILALESGDFRITVIRPPMVYGMDCPGNFGSLKKLALKTPIFPKVDNKRSMLYIENLTAAVYKIITEGIYGVVLPMDSEYVNTSDMVKKIAAAKGKKVILMPLVGEILQMLPLGVCKKVFGSLYYDKSAAMLCDFIDFDTAVKRSV